MASRLILDETGAHLTPEAEDEIAELLDDADAFAGLLADLAAGRPWRNPYRYEDLPYSFAIRFAAEWRAKRGNPDSRAANDLDEIAALLGVAR